MYLLFSIGDMGELKKCGSLHQYLMHLHENGEVPVTSFWWAKLHVVSVCSPQAFKELVGLVDRPGREDVKSKCVMMMCSVCLVECEVGEWGVRWVSGVSGCTA